MMTVEEALQILEAAIRMCQPKGTGNSAFFELAVALASAGMKRAEISCTLYA